MPLMITGIMSTNTKRNGPPGLNVGWVILIVRLEYWTNHISVQQKLWTIAIITNVHKP